MGIRDLIGNFRPIVMVVVMANLTPREMEVALGDELRKLRLSRNLDQNTVAERSGISVRALRRLEAGDGSTLHSLISVLRTLGRQDWLKTIAPVASINPLSFSRQSKPRQRASSLRKPKSE